MTDSLVSSSHRSNHGEEGSYIRPCVLCKKPVVPAFRPFCSQRCKDIDLGNWMLNRYAIPAEDADAQEDDTSPRDEEDRYIER